MSSSPTRLPTSGPPSNDKDEYARLMHSSPLNFPKGQEPRCPSSPGDGRSPAEPGSDVFESTPTRGVQNDTVAVRRLVERFKLHPYQRTGVEEFVKSSSLFRDAQIFVQQCALDNKLDSLLSATPPFTISAPLHLNMKSFIIAVLLSVKLAAYTGNIPRDHVLALIMRDRLHPPPNFDRDPHAAKVLEEEVNHELAQARSKLKKAIKKGNQDGHNVFDIATALHSSPGQ